jgi:hypothetical protein
MTPAHPVVDLGGIVATVAQAVSIANDLLAIAIEADAPAYLVEHLRRAMTDLAEASAANRLTPEQGVALKRAIDHLGAWYIHRTTPVHHLAAAADLQLPIFRTLYTHLLTLHAPEEIVGMLDAALDGLDRSLARHHLLAHDLWLLERAGAIARDWIATDARRVATA